MTVKTSSAAASSINNSRRERQVLLSPCSLFFSISLAASANSFCLPPPFHPSIYLVPSLSISFFFILVAPTRRDATAACACTRASDVGSTRRTCHANATPIYTRSLCFSFFLSHSFNTINLSVRHSDLVAMCARK